MTDEDLEDGHPSKGPGSTDAPAPDLGGTQARDLGRTQARDLDAAQARDLDAAQVPDLDAAQARDLDAAPAPDLGGTQARDLDDAQARDLDAAQARDLDAAQNSDLDARARAVLRMERHPWPTPGAKERAIREELAMSPTRYYQLLNTLLDDTRALAHDPVTVNRLRRLREEQRDRR